MFGSHQCAAFRIPTNPKSHKEYTKEDYVNQFTVRIPENLAKIDRVVKFHQENVPGVSSVLFDVLEKQRDRLKELQKNKGDYVSPLEL